MATGKGGGGGGKGGSFAPAQSYSPFAPAQSYSPFTPVASGSGTGYYNPPQQLAPTPYNPMMDAYGSGQNVMQPMSGYYNQYQLPGSNYQPYRPPRPVQQYQPFASYEPPVPQPQPNNNFFSNTSSYNPLRNQGGNYNTLGEGYGNSYANFTPDYAGQQNFYEPRPNYFGRTPQTPFQTQTQASGPAPAPAPTAAPTPAPSQNYNYSTEPDEVFQGPIFNQSTAQAPQPQAPLNPPPDQITSQDLQDAVAQMQQGEITVQELQEMTRQVQQQSAAPQPVQPQAPLNPPLDQNGPLGDIMQMSVGNLEPDMQYDANGDGRITSRDALMFQQSVAPEPRPAPIVDQPIYRHGGPLNIPSMPILDYQEPTVQQRYQQTIAARQQPQYVAPEPRIHGHQRTAQMPILDSADQVSAPANNPGFSGYDQNMFAPMQFGGIYV